MQTGSPDHIDQGIKTEQLYLAAHEVRDTWLCDAQQLSSL
jgi:hypothetical protein